MNIGENIKKYRLKSGLSREKLVLKCRGAFSSSHLLSVEKGRTKNPGVEMVSCIAEALGVSVDRLLKG